MNDPKKDSKCREVQTIIHCYPHIFANDTDVAKVGCDRSSQTAASAKPNIQDIDFYSLLQFTPYQEIEQGCLRKIDLPRKSRLQWYLQQAPELSVVSKSREDSLGVIQKGVLRHESPSPSFSKAYSHKPVYQDNQAQTDLTVIPYILETDKVASVRVEAPIQTYITCIKEESITDILSQLDSKELHTSFKISTENETVAKQVLTDMEEENDNEVNNASNPVEEPAEEAPDQPADAVTKEPGAETPNNEQDVLSDDLSPVKQASSGKKCLGYQSPPREETTIESGTPSKSNQSVSNKGILSQGALPTKQESSGKKCLGEQSPRGEENVIEGGTSLKSNLSVSGKVVSEGELPTKQESKGKTCSGEQSPREEENAPEWESPDKSGIKSNQSVSGKVLSEEELPIKQESKGKTCSGQQSPCGDKNALEGGTPAKSNQSVSVKNAHSTGNEKADLEENVSKSRSQSVAGDGSQSSKRSSLAQKSIDQPQPSAVEGTPEEGAVLSDETPGSKRGSQLPTLQENALEDGAPLNEEMAMKRVEKVVEDKFISAIDGYFKTLEVALNKVVSSYVNPESSENALVEGQGGVTASACSCDGGPNKNKPAGVTIPKAKGIVSTTKIMHKRTNIEKMDNCVKENIEEYVSTSTAYPVGMNPANTDISVCDCEGGGSPETPDVVCEEPEATIEPVGDYKENKRIQNISCECHPTEAGGAAPTIQIAIEECPEGPGGEVIYCECNVVETRNIPLGVSQVPQSTAQPISTIEITYCDCNSNDKPAITCSEPAPPAPKPEPVIENQSCLCGASPLPPPASKPPEPEPMLICTCGPAQEEIIETVPEPEVPEPQLAASTLVKARTVIAGKQILLECLLNEDNTNTDPNIENVLAICATVLYPHVVPPEDNFGQSSITDIEPKKGVCCKKKKKKKTEEPPPPPPVEEVIPEDLPPYTCTRCLKAQPCSTTEKIEFGQVTSSVKESQQIEEHEINIEVECAIVVVTKKVEESVCTCGILKPEPIIEGHFDTTAGVQTDLALGDKLESPSLNSLCGCDSKVVIPMQKIALESLGTYTIESVQLKITEWGAEFATSQQDVLINLRDELQNLVFVTTVEKLEPELSVEEKPLCTCSAGVVEVKPKQEKEIPIQDILLPKPCIIEKLPARTLCRLHGNNTAEVTKKEGTGLTVDFYLESFPSNITPVAGGGAATQPTISVCSTVSDMRTRPKRCSKDIAIEINVETSFHGTSAQGKTQPFVTNKVSSIVMCIKSSTECEFKSEVTVPARNDLKEKRSVILNVVNPTPGNCGAQLIKTTVSFREFETANKQSKPEVVNDKLCVCSGPAAPPPPPNLPGDFDLESIPKTPEKKVVCLKPDVGSGKSCVSPRLAAPPPPIEPEPEIEDIPTPIPNTCRGPCATNDLASVNPVAPPEPPIDETCRAPCAKPVPPVITEPIDIPAAPPINEPCNAKCAKPVPLVITESNDLETAKLPKQICKAVCAKPIPEIRVPTPPPTSTCACNQLKAEQFKEDPVGAALKAYEAEMKPLREALTQLREKIRNLNITDLEGYQRDVQRPVSQLPKTYRSKVYVSKEPHANTKTVIRMKPRNNSLQGGVIPDRTPAIQSAVPPSSYQPTDQPLVSSHPSPPPDHFDSFSREPPMLQSLQMPLAAPMSQLPFGVNNQFPTSSYQPQQFMAPNTPQFPFSPPPFAPQQMMPPPNMYPQFPFSSPMQQTPQVPPPLNYMLPGISDPFSQQLQPLSPLPQNVGTTLPYIAGFESFGARDAPQYGPRKRSVPTDLAMQARQYGMYPDCRGRTYSDENMAYNNSENYDRSRSADSGYNRKRLNEYLSDVDDSDDSDYDGEDSGCPFIELLRSISRRSLMNHGYACSSSKKSRKKKRYRATSAELRDCENLVMGQAIRTTPENVSGRPNSSRKANRDSISLERR